MFERHVIITVACYFCETLEASTEHYLIFYPKQGKHGKDLCRMKHNSKSRNRQISFHWTASFLEEFRKARSLIVSQPCYRSCIKVQKWFKPTVGHFRLDVDAGYQDHLGRFSVEAVVIDHLGRICAASTCGIRDLGSVLAAEISDILHGLLLITQSDFNNVMVFSDSVNAVQRINSSSERFL